MNQCSSESARFASVSCIARAIPRLQVEAESVEYWDSPSSSIMQAYRMVRTALTGEWDTMGDHERKRIAESA